MLEITISPTALPELSISEVEQPLEAWAAMLYHLHNGYIEDLLYNALAAVFEEEDLKKILQMTSKLIDYQIQTQSQEDETVLLEMAKIPIIGNQDVDSTML